MTTDISKTAAGSDKGARLLGAMIRKMTYDQKRSIIVSLAAFCALCMAYGLILGISSTGGGTGEVIFYGFIAITISLVYASLCFNDMKTKESRLATLMQPATVWNKFLPRLIYAFILVPIVMAAGYFVVELGRLIGSVAMYGKGIVFVWPWNVFDMDLKFNDIFLIVISAVFMMSIYFYGGILWPRISFLKTSALIWGIQIVLSIVASLSIAAILRHGYTIVPLIDDLDVIQWMVISVLALLSILFIWLAYRRFRDSTIMYNSRKQIKK